uniref:Serine/threonine-protein kinase PpkA n=1 Tax=Candidatus Kentrum sp. DK TaxID=2126562 RepID=A0A450RWF5_9GAMM|nr:MAG: serine/threonine-protein kinase PpkA [Candidatus Kentron sp. DK]
MRSILFLFLLTVLCLPALASAAQRDGYKPLLMEGKQSLYQRVLAKPGAAIRPRPEVSSSSESRPVTPFTVYYVYSRRMNDGMQWIEVGANAHGNVIGWIPERELVEWKQTLTVAFRDPVGHDRVLLFRDRDSLKELVEERDVAAYKKLYRKAQQGRLSEDEPVVAIQPEGHLDLRKDFYLVPIHQHEDVYLGDRNALMLKVTSVPLLDEGQSIEPFSEVSEKPTGIGEKTSDYRAGVVFVIDSTLSMGPYIDRTREAVRKVYTRLEQNGLIKMVNFGLVDFRDNVQAARGLGYLAQVQVTLSEGASPRGFFSRVNALSAAQVSSQDFVEDAYAGVKLALDAIDWRGYDARYIVLITDAGARDGQDPLSHTGLDTQALRQIAKDSDVAILVLHLLTPSGMSDHASAARQYKALSHYPGIGDFYYGVETGNVTRFGRALDALANQISNQVQEVTGVEPVKKATGKEQVRISSNSLTVLQEKVAKLGYALRMRYVRKHKNGRVPAVFDAWLLDHDFQNPERPTLDVRVLLSRDQLSDLQYVLRQVLTTAEEGLLSPRNFLNDLKSLAASLRRAPDEIGSSTIAASGTGTNLADLGYMREYIEDLPYTGEIMDLSLETWESWPARQQLAFIDGLENRINYYKALHDHTDLWISLDGGPVNGDSVFALPLDMLP